MEIKGICSPSRESDEEESPVASLELCKQAERIRQWLRILPFCSFLSICIDDGDSVLPAKEIGKRLLCDGEDSSGHWVCWLIWRHVA